ncbi:hypothetical protein BG005_001451 [Podila minutissima]|nr:hypothetical protein BG005_001451 [Podila minutissima]
MPPITAVPSAASSTIATPLVASPVSSSSIMPHNTNTLDQYQSIMSSLQKLATQDQF